MTEGREGYYSREDSMIVHLQGLIGGLIEQQDRAPTVGLQSGYAQTGREPNSCEGAVGPTHCLRTVSQRSLSTPVTFLSAPVHIAAAVDVFDALVTNAVTGCLPGVGLGGVAPIVFHDADVQAQRQRIDELVLWGARAKVAVQAVAGAGGIVDPFNVGLYVKTIEDFIRQYVVFRVFNTADDGDPWVNDTPLIYLDRSNDNFVAVPPILWKDRDPQMQLDVRVADFGAGAGALPTLELGTMDFDAQCSIMFETLWIPSPEHCGAFWPGSLCPKHHVKNAPGYKGR